MYFRIRCGYGGLIEAKKTCLVRSVGKLSVRLEKFSLWSIQSRKKEMGM